MIGHGAVRATADKVDFTLGVEVVRSDAGQAFTAAAASATAVLAVLADGGIDSRHVRTADFRLGPKTNYQNGQEVLLGYAAGQNLVASLHGLSTLSRLLTDLATTGVEGVRFDGLSFSTADPAAAVSSARELAMADAQTKAAHYARLAGRNLGPITAISEAIPYGPVPVFKREMAMAASMPIASGESEVTVSVEVHFELI